MNIDHAKLARLNVDLDQARMTLQGLAAEYRHCAEEHSRLKSDIVANLRNTSAEWSPRDEIGALLLLPVESQRQIGLMSLLPQVRTAAAERERMKVMQVRIDELQTTVTPLAQLVSRLNKFASEQ